MNISYDVKVKIKHIYSSYKTCEIWRILFCVLKQQCWESGHLLSESTLTYCFECGCNASECFCWASSRMEIKPVPWRSLKALQCKSCYCQWTMEMLMPRKVIWLAYANKRVEQTQVLWIPVLFTRLHCLLEKCNSRADYCFQGSLATLSYKKTYKRWSLKKEYAILCT